jgi:catechol 2,3-dioxygenase-like lactoylglutathione lyase family enzyme
MSVLGIDQITYGADDLPTCRQFFEDWGLALKSQAADELVFECLNGCRWSLRRWTSRACRPRWKRARRCAKWCGAWRARPTSNATPRAIAQDPAFFDATVDGARRIGCTDPNGLAVRLQVSRKHAVQVDCGAMNTWNAKPRVNQAAPIYERATPIEVGHVVFFVNDVKTTSAFYASASASSRPTATPTGAPSCAARPRAATTTCSCCRFLRASAG